MSGSEAIATTKYGRLQGRFEDGLYVFRGVAFAAPPTGNRRWLPPEPPCPWTGIRPALRFGTICPQGEGTLMAFREPAAPEPQDEDCLFLNVWTPGLDPSTGSGQVKRPVMVWIHGGAFARGSGSTARQPAQNLARRGGVVVVSVNYRLGPLGFLNLQKVPGSKIPATGNEGLLDQIAALQWVKDNIAQFGGDPSNVTAFGESAGAMSIGCLLAMPAACGLFQKAILQSGASTFHPLEHAAVIGRTFLKHLGVKAGDTETLRSLAPQALLDVRIPPQELAGMHGVTYEPVAGGETMPEVPLDAIRRGSAKPIVILTGSNLDESRLFGANNPAMKKLDENGLRERVERMIPPDYGAKIIERYRAIRTKRGLSASPADILMAIQTDMQFRIPNVRVAEFQHALGARVYSYLFDWASAQPGLGACHALDVGFVFNCLDKGFHGEGPEAEKLVGQMQDAWIAFARAGDPSSESLGEWPTYGDKRRTMILGRNTRIEASPYEEERAVWDGVPNGLLG